MAGGYLSRNLRSVDVKARDRLGSEAPLPTEFCLFPEPGLDIWEVVSWLPGGALRRREAPVCRVHTAHSQGNSQQTLCAEPCSWFLGEYNGCHTCDSI